MKVKLTISRAGPGVVQNAGDEIDVGNDEGKRLIEAGHAIPLAKKKPVERAVKK